MIIEITRNEAKPSFTVGELVELNRDLFDDDKGYILIVTADSAHTFSGTLLQLDEGLGVDFSIGRNDKGYHKDKFVKFTGSLKLTQG